MKILKSTQYSLLLSVLLFALASCGNSENNDTDNDSAINKSGGIKTGIFLDSAVKGLHYNTGSQTGITGDQGDFKYVEGETVEFSFGKVVIGSARAKPVMTPVDLVPGAVDYNNSTVINIVRLLQTLDSDGDTSSRIEIDSTTTSSATVQINFSLSESDFASNTDVLAIIGTVRSQTQLVETKTAVAHFQETLGKVNTNNNDTAPTSFVVEGQLFGLVGTLVIQNKDKETLSLTKNGAFTFNTPVSKGGDYAVSITAQPDNQICQLENAYGTNVTANVTSILITCFTSSFSIGGTISGLIGTLEIKNNGSDNLTLTENSRFTFPVRVERGGSYALEIVTPPEGQVCSIVKGRGEFVYTDIADISITCDVKSFNIGGTVEGLAAGNTLELLNNDTDKKTISANGNFIFDLPVVVGKSYSVKVQTQPKGQTCDVTNASGDNVTEDIISVQVVCNDNPFTIGGNVTGLNGTLVLQTEGEDDLTITKDGSFIFSPRVVAGTNYDVTVLTQPTDPVLQLCTVTKGSGNNITASVTNISVVCEDRILLSDFLPNFVECTDPLPRPDELCGSDKPFAACVKENAAEKGWTYVDEVTSLDCNQSKKGVLTQTDIFSVPGVDDIRDVTKFTKLKSLDLGFNRLNQLVPTDLSDLAEMNLSYLNLAKNARFPSLEVDISLSLGGSSTLSQSEAHGVLRDNILVSEISDVNRLDIKDDLTIDFAISDFNPCGSSSFCISGAMWGYLLAIELHSPLGNQLCGFDTGTLGSTFRFNNRLDEIFDSPPRVLNLNCLDIDTFSVTPAMSDRRRVHSSAILNNKIYVTGGVDTLSGQRLSSAEVYDPTSDSWSPITSMNFARSAHSTVALNGEIYVIGGGISSGITASVEIYDPLNNAWSPGAPLNEARYGHDSVVLNSKIYVVGGVGASYSPTSVEVFDPDTGSWSVVAPMPSTRLYHHASVLNQKIYVTGGWSPNILPSGAVTVTPLQTVEVYDSGTNTWTSVASMNIPRYGHGSYVLNDKLYVSGGDGTGLPNATTEVYDDVSDTWTTLASDAYLQDVYSTQESLGGKVFKFGGKNWSKEGFIFDPLLIAGNPFSTPDVFSNAPNSVIPDNSTAPLASTINVSGTRAIVTPSLNIDIEIFHSAAEELTIDLISPKGTSVRLWSPGGVSTTNIIGNFPSTLSVSGDLSVLNSEAMDGVWTLRIQDGGTKGTGSLVSWGIRP